MAPVANTNYYDCPNKLSIYHPPSRFRYRRAQSPLQVRGDLQPALPALQLQGESQDVYRRADAPRLGDERVQVRGLDGEGSVGHVRRVLRQPSGSQKDPDGLWVPGTPVQVKVFLFS